MRVFLMLALLLTLTGELFAAATAPATPTDPAALAKAMKRDLSNFSFELDKRGPHDQANPLPVVILSVPGVDLLPAEHVHIVQINEAQAARIIDALKSDGTLAQCAPFIAQGGEEKLPRGYVLYVRAGTAGLVSADLGWGLSLLENLQHLKAALPADGANAVDTVLDRLADDRKQWTDQGRVYERNGLAVLAKPAQTPLPGVPSFNVTIENTWNKDLAIVEDPASLETYQAEGWELLISEGTGSWHVVIPQVDHKKTSLPKATMIPAGKTINFVLSLQGCMYDRVGHEMLKKVPAGYLPPGKYQLTMKMRFTDGLADAIAPTGADKWLGTVATSPVNYELAPAAIQKH